MFIITADLVFLICMRVERKFFIHLSHPVDLLLSFDVRRRASSVNIFPRRTSSILKGIRHMSTNIVKMHNLFNLLCCQAYIRQTKYIKIITKEVSTSALNFTIDPCKRGY